MKVKQIIKELQQLDPEKEIAVDYWQEEDVLTRAEQRDIVLTNEEVGKTLDYMYDHYDSQNGLTWDTLDYALDDILRERELEKDG